MKEQYSLTESPIVKYKTVQKFGSLKFSVFGVLFNKKLKLINDNFSSIKLPSISNGNRLSQPSSLNINRRSNDTIEEIKNVKKIYQI